MKNIVKKLPTRGLWLEESTIPDPKEGEVLIKTRKTSICGTDLHIYKWDDWAQKTIPVPMTIGHEFMGEIAKLGPGVKDLNIGDRISGEGHITCGKCSNCRNGKKHLCAHTLGLGVNRPGCFAEYFTLPAENVFVLPSDIEDDLAAIFDPFGNAMHATLANSITGEDVLITGAGPIGCMSAAIASKAGARYVVITDVNEYRLNLAKTLGATHTVNVRNISLRAALKDLPHLPEFSVGIEMSGHPEGLNTLLDMCQNGAHLALLGILPNECTINWHHVIFKMLTLKGIYGREIFSTWEKMTHMLESKLHLAPVITHHFSIDDFEEAFQAALSGMTGKIILEW